MISKNLDIWRRELSDNIITCNIKLAGAMSDPHCSETIRQYYRDTLINNQDMLKTLAHIKQYGSSYNPEKCPLCYVDDVEHCSPLKYKYKMYSKWITQATNNTN